MSSPTLASLEQRLRNAEARARQLLLMTWVMPMSARHHAAPHTTAEYAAHTNLVGRVIPNLRRQIANKRARNARRAGAARTIQTAYRAHRARRAAATSDPALNSLRNSLAAIRAGGQGRNVREIYNNMGNMWYQARNRSAAARIMNNAQLFLNRRGQLALSARRLRSPSPRRRSPSRSRSPRR